MQAAADAKSSGRTPSLRWRLTIWVVAVFILIQFATGSVFWWMRKNDSDRLFRERLGEYAAAVAGRIKPRFPGIAAGELDAMGRQGSALVQFPWIEIDIVDETGMSLVRPKPRAPEGIMRLLEQHGSGQAPLWVRMERGQSGVDGSMIAVGVPLDANAHGDALVVVTTTDALYLYQSSLLMRVFLSAGLLGVGASAISGWLIAGIAVAPFHTLSQVAERLGPETIDDEIDLGDGDSEVQELMQELEDARTRIRDAFAAQERFLSNVSHEIKTPIATLITQAQTLRHDELTDEGRDFVDYAEDEMRKLGALVESFLTLTRVRNGGTPAKLKRLPANELALDAVEDCSVYAEEHGVRLRLMLDDSEDAMDAAVLGDAALLNTLLSNLLRNAVRFSPPESAIHVRTEIADGSLHVHVRDEGPGLPEEVIPEIFDRFVQSGPQVKRERGNGLGLAIAKGIAELHNGDIAVRNNDDSGATFSVNLPLAEHYA